MKQTTHEIQQECREFFLGTHKRQPTEQELSYWNLCAVIAEAQGDKREEFLEMQRRYSGRKLCFGKPSPRPSKKAKKEPIPVAVEKPTLQSEAAYDCSVSFSRKYDRFPTQEEVNFWIKCAELVDSVGPENRDRFLSLMETFSSRQVRLGKRRGGKV